MTASAKRAWLAGAALGLATAVAPADRAAAGPGAPRPNAPRPSVVLVVADDLGLGDVGVYGATAIRTPRLDQLAAEGLRFTSGYAGAASCAPSRAVLFTGKHVGHASVRGNVAAAGPLAGKAVPLAAEDVTVAERLREAGYDTALIGKWGLGALGTAAAPDRKGFTSWFGFLDQGEAHDHYPDRLFRDGARVELPENRDGARGTYADDLFTDAALAFLAKPRPTDQPFFLALAYTLPHQRYEVPALDPYASEPWPERERAYAAMVTRLDRDVGRIVDRVDALGLGERTLVAFVSDNGPAEWTAASRVLTSAAGLSGTKRTLGEGGIRVPWIVRWRGHARSGAVVDEPVHFADWLPTLASLAGAAPASSGLDGSDLSPLLGTAPATLPERPLYWELHKDGFAQALRLGRWKLVRSQDGRSALFDLTTDPGELRDHAAEQPGVVARLGSILASARTPHPAWP